MESDALRTIPRGKPMLPRSATRTDLYRSAELVAERRQIAYVLRSGRFTPLSVRLFIPEDLREVNLHSEARVAETVARFGGFVALYVGDGVVIYFGWPEAREANAERAVRAALAVVAAVGEMRVRGPLHVRIGYRDGVSGGEVFSGGRAPQPEVMGATPNCASRLQEVAGPNGIMIALSRTG